MYIIGIFFCSTDIQHILKHKEWKGILNALIEKILANVEEIESEQGVRVVKTSKISTLISSLSMLFSIVLKDLEDFGMIELSSGLKVETVEEVKSTLVDFMYRFKDKQYLFTVLSKL